MVSDCRIMTGDCVEMMKSLPDCSVDAVVTDPPYGLEFMGKEWDRLWDKRSGTDKAKMEGTGNIRNAPVYKAGKEAKDWHERWAREALRVLKPGGHLLAFSGTRTYHWLACAVEDAGFEIRDMVEWIYSTGFPKSLDIGKAIDKMAGVERTEMEWRDRFHDGGCRSNTFRNEDGRFPQGTKGNMASKPATDAAKKWSGWGTALKPAHEPVCMARKPLIGTVAINVLTHGTGAINIDGCRVGTEEHSVNVNDFSKHYGAIINREPVPKIGERTVVGRWPANLIHDGSDAVLALFPDAEDDSGSAARFFYVAKPTTEERDFGLEGFQSSNENLQGLDTRGRTLEREDGTKALVERFIPQPRVNTHPTVKALTLMEYLVKLVTPPNGTVLDPFMGSGTTGMACARLGFNFIGIEREAEYVRIAEARIKRAHEVTVVEEKKRKQQKGWMDYE